MTGRRSSIEGVFEAFAEGRFGAAIPLFDEHVVLVVADEIPDGGRYVGLDGVRDYMTRFLEPWERLTIAATSIDELGETFLVKVDQRGTGRESGVPADLEYVQLWTFRGDKVIRLDVLLNEDRAQEMLRRDG